MLHYLRGDATDPSTSGPKIIAHICNDQGYWGKGFVLAISARWPQPEEAYRRWSQTKMDGEEPFSLGAVQLVAVAPDVWVANMIAQHGIRAKMGVPPIRYGALETCLHKLIRLALARQATLHLPRIGCGLAGGSWDKVSALLEKMVGSLEVYIYDLQPLQSKG